MATTPKLEVTVATLGDEDRWFAEAMFGYDALSVNGWGGHCYLTFDNQRLSIAELTVWPSAAAREAGHGITSAVLRDLRLGELLEQVQRGLFQWAEWSSPPEEPSLAARVRRIRRLKPARGRIGYGDDHYETFARLYLDMQERHGVRGLRKQLAERLDKHENTIGDWIHEARAREFLTPAIPGRGGAAAGPRLRTMEREQ